MTKSEIKEKLLIQGAANLREFGYPSVTKDNVMESTVTRAFFRMMLEENNGKSLTWDEVISELIAEIDSKEEKQ